MESLSEIFLWWNWYIYILWDLLFRNEYDHNGSNLSYVTSSNFRWVSQLDLMLLYGKHWVYRETFNRIRLESFSGRMQSAHNKNCHWWVDMYSESEGICRLYLYICCLWILSVTDIYVWSSYYSYRSNWLPSSEEYSVINTTFDSSIAVVMPFYSINVRLGEFLFDPR